MWYTEICARVKMTKARTKHFLFVSARVNCDDDEKSTNASGFVWAYNRKRAWHICLRDSKLRISLTSSEWMTKTLIQLSFLNSLCTRSAPPASTPFGFVAWCYLHRKFDGAPIFSGYGWQHRECCCVLKDGYGFHFPLLHKIFKISF